LGKLKPAFHFLLLGTALFLLIGRESPRDEIHISSQELVTIKQNWERANRAEAGPAVLKYILNNAIYNEILLREALTLHFHQTDTVVWNRLIRNMRFASQEAVLGDEDLFVQALALDMHRSDLIVRRRLIARMEHFIKQNYAIDAPDDPVIDAFIKDNPDLFSRGERVSFCHVFLAATGKPREAEQRGKRLLLELEKGNLSPENAYKRGDLFPYPYCFRDVSSSYVENLFGKPFLDDLLASKAAAWSGPFHSGYGTHLVRLENMTVTGVLELPENRNRAKNHLTVTREEQLLQDIVTELGRKYYSVLIDGVPVERFRLENLLEKATQGPRSFKKVQMKDVPSPMDKAAP
jgi:hypothetical protein